MKSIFHLFQRAFSCKKCLKPERATLKHNCNVDFDKFFHSCYSFCSFLDKYGLWKKYLRDNEPPLINKEFSKSIMLWSGLRNIFSKERREKK